MMDLKPKTPLHEKLIKILLSISLVVDIMITLVIGAFFTGIIILALKGFGII